MENYLEYQINLNGHEVNYVKKGVGEPIIFLHNGGGFWQTWIKQIDYYSKKYTVFGIDWPGFGESAYPNEPISLSLLTQTLTSFISELNLSKVILVGNCIGGSTALNYAQLFPEKVEKLVAFNVCPGKHIYRYAHYSYLIKSINKSPFIKKHISSLLAFVFTKTFVKKNFPAVLFEDSIDRQDFLFQKYIEKIKEEKQTKSRLNIVFSVDTFTVDQFMDPSKPVAHHLVWGEKNKVTPLEKHGYMHNKHLDPIAFNVIKEGSHLCMYEREMETNEIIDHAIK